MIQVVFGGETKQTHHHHLYLTQLYKREYIWFFCIISVFIFCMCVRERAEVRFIFSSCIYLHIRVSSLSRLPSAVRSGRMGNNLFSKNKTITFFSLCLFSEAEISDFPFVAYKWVTVCHIETKTRPCLTLYLKRTPVLLITVDIFKGTFAAFGPNLAFLAYLHYHGSFISHTNSNTGNIWHFCMEFTWSLWVLWFPDTV